ncbi:MAG: hypothetical protein CL910_15390 [Deltaproteobacteria bacterium]|nr:hypothetical protein [Deltaproteobacteria bacterium]
MNVQAVPIDVAEAPAEAHGSGEAGEGSVDSVFAGLLSDEMAGDGDEELAQEGEPEELSGDLVAAEEQEPGAQHAYGNFVFQHFAQALITLLKGVSASDLAEQAEAAEQSAALPTEPVDAEASSLEEAVAEAIAVPQEQPEAELEAQAQSGEGVPMADAPEAAEPSSTELAMAHAPLEGARSGEPAPARIAEPGSARSDTALATEGRVAASAAGHQAGPGGDLGDQGNASGQNALMREALASDREPGLPPTVGRSAEFETHLEGRLQAPTTSNAPQPEPVAVDSTLATPGVAAPAANAAPTTSTAVGAPEEALPVQVEWLAARGGGNARFQLHPPNLGEVNLSVTVRGSAVDIVIQVQDQAAQLVAQTRDLLAQGLGTRDLHIDQFEVRTAQTDLGTSDGSPRDETAEHTGTGASTGESGDRSEPGEGESPLVSDLPPEVADLTMREELRVDTTTNVDLKV